MAILFLLKMLEARKMVCGKLLITSDEIDKMEKLTVAIFEIIEKCWQTKVRLSQWCQFYSF